MTPPGSTTSAPSGISRKPAAPEGLSRCARNSKVLSPGRYRSSVRAHRW